MFALRITLTNGTILTATISMVEAKHLGSIDTDGYFHKESGRKYPPELIEQVEVVNCDDEPPVFVPV